MAFTSSYTPGLIQQSEYIYATPNITIPGNVSGSITSTASFGTYLGDGSQLTGVGGGVPAGTVSGSAQITELGFVTSSATASFVLNSQTSSMSVATASYVETAQTASYVLQAVSASYAPTAPGILSSSAQIATDISGAFSSDSASFSTRVTTNETNISTLTASTASYVLASQTSSMTVLSSSFAVSASYAPSADTFPFTGSAIITGSLTVLGEFNAFRVNSTNLSLGSGAGFNNTINGPRNVFLGQNAGYTNTNGDDNVCIGYAAGYALSTNASDFNVFIGRLAGAGGTSPVARMSDANYNIGIGQEALLYLTSGDSNIGFGFRTMRNISSGTYNIAFGDAALSSTSTGQNNIGIGRSAGNLQTTGTGNITIGSGSQGIAGESNQLRIGHGNTLTTISASLETGDIIFASTASAAYFVGDGSQLTNVASPFTAAGISGSFTAPSASFSTRITTNETDISTLTAATASYLTSLPAGVLSGSAQIATEISGAFVAPSASFSTRVTTLEDAGGGGTPTFIASGSTSASAAPDTGVVVEHSGSTAFSVIGDVGTLFSVDDDLTGTLFSANDISGFPVLQADATGEVYLGKSPQSLYTTAVISSTTAATTHSLCTLSTSSYDGGFFEYTAHSASNARAGNIMSTWNGSNIVYAETTTIDIGDTSDLTTEVIISGSTARLVAYGANAGYKIKTIIKAI